MLTRKQHELLMFIDNQIKTTGISPSFDEMRTGLGLRSKSGIHRLVSSLEERGFLLRWPNRARAVEVLRLPGSPPRSLTGVNENLAYERGTTFAPTVIRGDFSPRLGAVRTATEVGAVGLPLYGRIAAGLPIEAIRDEGAAQIEVPVAMVASGEHFALEVAGDSMMDAGILDGDIVVIRRTDLADNGQIVVALVDESEVTLKRLRRRGQSVALEPANTRYKPQIYPADRVRVQGRMVALMRQYH